MGHDAMDHSSLALTGLLGFAVLLLCLFLYLLIRLTTLLRQLRHQEETLRTVRRELQRWQGELLAVRGALTAIGQDWQGTMARHGHETERGLQDLGRRMIIVEQELKQLSTRQEQVELRDPDQRSYERAVQLVRRGAGVEDLTASCGLSRGEAELLIAVNRQDEVATPP